MKTTVADILKRKGHWVLTAERSASVYDTIAKMVEHNVGAVLVMDGDRIAGIFTERDYLRRIVLQGRTSKTTMVEEVMTPDVLYVSPGHTLEECMVLMTNHTCRHLPVVEGDQLKGILSIGDCVKELSAEAQARARSLEEYITGQYPG